MKNHSLVVVLALLALAVLPFGIRAAHTGEIAVASSQEKENTLVVSFSNHAHETNSLWVAYGNADRGEGTNGWQHVERVRTVLPADESVEYALPVGWGTTVKAIRFFLSEVPYDYDYTLDFLRSGDSATTGYGNKRIVLNDFSFNTKYRVGLKMREIKHNGSSNNLALFSTRDTQGSGTPYYTLFWIGGANWRFDYNTVNANSVAGATVEEIYNIMADGKNGLWVNGKKLQKAGVTYTYLDKAVTGKLEFFCANQAAGSMSNSNGNMDLFGAQVYDSPDADAKLLVNLVPMVKNGRAGMYDTVRNKYYYNDTTAGDFKLTVGPSRVESGDPFFVSALCKAAATGPEVFMPASFTEDANDYTNAYGGVLMGPAPLKLTGSNDWGGSFIISNGTLVAGLGRGLGEFDHLTLSGSATAAYGGWDGAITNRIGDGQGEITVAGTGSYIGFGAADGDLTVNLGGAEDPEPLVLTSELRRLALNNDGYCTGTLRILNPILFDDAFAAGATFVIRSKKGLVRLEGNILGSGSASGPTLAMYGDSVPQGAVVFAGCTNNFKTYQNFGGRYVFGEGTTNVFGGNFYVYAGECIVSNAIIRATGEAGYVSGISVTGGCFSVIGGSVTVSQLLLGGAANQGSKTELQPKMEVSGKVTLDESLSKDAYGSTTIRGDCASAALTLREGADFRCNNVNLYRRNLYIYGGEMRLSGSYGLNDMGKEGTARCTLLGGTLYAPRAIQAGVAGAIASFVFAGGKLVNTRSGNEVFFQNFNGTSAVEVAGKFGGEFETKYDVLMTNALVTSTAQGNTWNYAKEQYLTAPAFKKSGPKTLTLTKPSTYVCATDVAEGTLKLADEGSLLPTTVARLTGGTFDLGGNDQTLKALCGTAGEVKNGSVTVTEGIYPGGAGTIGSFSVGAALAGTLFVDVDATGAADSLVTTTALDLSNIDLVITAPATAPEVPHRLKVVNGPYTGEFKSVSGLPEGWTIHYVDGRVTIGPDRGTAIILR